MVTHHLNDDNQGGYFADDYGRKLCRWTWDAKTKDVSVRVGQTEKRVNLSSFGIHRFSDEESLARLIAVAKETGECLRGKPFGD